MPQLPPLTKALILACVGVFFLFELIPGAGWFALWPLQSGNFMPWQPLTYAFLHGGFTHLLFNMLGLWMFGSELERVWGRRRYAQLLLAGALTAALAQLVFSVLMHSNAPTVGASGALFALLLSFGMLFPNRIITPLIPPIPMKAKYFVAIFGTLELLLGTRILDFGPTNVAHFAHLGGMLGAYVLIRYWRTRGPRRLR
ncbi:rhomboid family intramembrane serine protease [Pelomonas sp. V22]|uniref:rhomboid family intramembrane serine protease n=1 Tax=Pelomonas sp. V22 TaxID=2822139 RepID=UPI0024A84892|nr:rhomboid family intramembrane serine protease [Pelomonas sp. V22]MDI4631751.1 rhomboid family intramembrane serine protease [Pelomonas sp. V22]